MTARRLKKNLRMGEIDPVARWKRKLTFSHFY